MHSSLPGRADSARLTVAVLLAVLLHLALAQVPIAWRAPVAPLAAPIQISLLSPPAAPPAAAPGPVAPAPPAVPASVAEIVPVPQAAPSKPESKPEPPEPRRSVVATKVAKPREPIRPVAKPKPVKPKPVKPKPVKPKSIQPAEPAQDPPVRLAAHHPQSTPASPSSMPGGGGLGNGAVSGASASRGAGGAPSTMEAKLRPLPGNPQPRYPSLARRRGEEGRVLLRLTVDTTGRVEAVSIARSSGYELLDQEAQRTVARWRFQSPPTERMVAQIPITFRLRD
ncbi:energy transducer TonB [Candidatus Competibacter phosphatis]|uniref:Protein TonB n=1 Tax=Candidatus Competibacter phosphatis TaxID=221280 RepID=A0ABX1TPC1_9GAMM|nr:energy transducer TonB [Candidatus Competibacter phosphatis]NMQ20255.1 energy transducer TonB [Candidatus Competibacter phosphatis]